MIMIYSATYKNENQNHFIIDLLRRINDINKITLFVFENDHDHI